MPNTVRGPADGRRTPGRPVAGPAVPRPPAPRTGPGAFTSRRTPGSRRSGAGLSVGQRGLRNRWGLALMITLLVLVIGKLAVLQGVDGAAYANAAEQDRLRTYPIAALRGAVLDRDGNPFAYTVAASRVVADPQVVTNPGAVARALTTLLDVPVPELTEKLSRDSRYVVLGTQVAPETTDAIEALELSGVSFEDDPVRLYPAGTVGGQVIGFVGREGA
ncbi:MAG: ftsI, partial [Blastococcus sp.]|nr:ftsI [Blastococcus sp.]